MQSDEPSSLPPITPRMVANWAEMPISKALKIQLATAGALAVVVMFVLFQLARPAIWQAIGQLPNEAAIEDGALRWPNTQARALGTSSMISFAVDPTASGGLDRLSDWQIVLGPRATQIRSFLGYVEVPYVPGWRVDLSRNTVDPLYGAWEAPIFVGLGVVTAALLMLSWHGLGAIYGLVILVLAKLWVRPTEYSKAYKVGMATLFPGSLLMFVGLLGYGFGAVALPRVLALWLLHVVLAWVYVLLAPSRLPDGVVRNPFKPKVFGEEEKPPEAINPFSPAGK